jgi:hypothetical protein
MKNHCAQVCMRSEAFSLGLVGLLIALCGLGWAPSTGAQTFSVAQEFVDFLTGVALDYDDPGAAWGDYDNDGDLDLVAWGAEFTLCVYRNNAGTFTEIEAGLPAAKYGSAAWGDYDNDGDLDLVLTGLVQSQYSSVISRVYRNDAGVFTDIAAGLLGVCAGSVAWGDYDNDNDLDLALSGNTDGPFGQPAISHVYRNDAGVFVNIAAGLPEMSNATPAWGDYDNDGDLDLLLTGGADIGYDISHVYRNDAGIFTDSEALLQGAAPLVWGDYDNDGDLDLLAASRRIKVFRNDGGAFTGLESMPDGGDSGVWGDYDADGDLDLMLVRDQPAIYRNDAAVFTDIEAWLPASLSGLVADWIDYDGDGDLDLALLRGAGSRVYRNDAGRFNFGLPSLDRGAAVWGDYDNDGDLDLAVTGDKVPAGNVSRVYRNDSGWFTNIAAGLPGVSNGSVAWGDYDNDDDLDLVLTGGGYGAFPNSPMDPLSRVYRNDSEVFTDIAAGLPGVQFGSAVWGDYDNDGDLDLVLTGESALVGAITCVYRNDRGSFTDIGAGLQSASQSAAAWGDYDNDGDLDLVVAGYAGYDPAWMSDFWTAHVYRNDSGIFTDILADLPRLPIPRDYFQKSTVAWGDYDSDGDLDLVIAGPGIVRVYRNDAGALSDIDAGLLGLWDSSAAWADYDNDGDLDLALTGWPWDSGDATRVYRNDAGGFTNIAEDLPKALRGSAAWGDYDNDGDSDLLLIGADWNSFTPICRNEIATANTPPTAPAALSALVVGDQVTLSWGTAMDAETPTAGLSYNLRIGTTPGGSQVVSAMSDEVSGYRRVAALGNAQQRTAWVVTLPPADCYWSVQSVDGAWAGSPFSEEQVLARPVAVYLVQFLAVRFDQQAIVHWAISQPRAQTEFHVWREEAGSERVRISAALASGQEAYEFVDSKPPLGPTNYWLQEVAANGLDSWYGPAHLEGFMFPATVRLYPCQPNPFNPRTTIRYDLPESGPVCLSVFDVAGRRIRTLVDDSMPQGSHEAVWDGRDSSGREVGSGSYLARLEFAGRVETVRMGLVR